ncbi:MAG: pantetheine-phosphate adenylyltransferase [Candidatus Altiarchaeota archaeon]
MFKRVVVGGTFNVVHAGHRELIETAFEIAEEVVVGLSSDEFANRFRTFNTRPFETRKKDIEKYISGFKRPYRIVEINDIYGDATTDVRMDALVVSEETLLRAQEINAIRFKKGLEKLNIIVVPIVVGKDGHPISCDRIEAGEIDLEGKSLK